MLCLNFLDKSRYGAKFVTMVQRHGNIVLIVQSLPQSSNLWLIELPHLIIFQIELCRIHFDLSLLPHALRVIELQLL